MIDERALASRARRASEWSRLRAALRVAPHLASLVAFLGLVAPDPRAAILTALIAATLLVARWWRRPEGRGATDGVMMGAPVGVAGALVATCLEPGGWECGVPCVVVGLGSALAAAARSAGASRRERLAVGLFGAATAFAGCAALGIGAALAVSVMTAATWAGVSALRARQA